MPKQRAPISTRLRNRDKNGAIITSVREVSRESVKKEEPISAVINDLIEENIIFSPRTDPDIYMDELQSPLSFVRGTEEERHEFLKEEDDVMSQSFGSDYKSSLNTSTFYNARVSAPVPSKRTSHLKIQTKSSPIQKSTRPSLSDLPYSKRKKTSPSLSPSPSVPPSPSPSASSFASPSSTPTPTTNTKSSFNFLTSSSKAKKTVSSMKDRTGTSTAIPTNPKPTFTLNPTQLILQESAASALKTGSGKKSISLSKKAYINKKELLPAKNFKYPNTMTPNNTDINDMEETPAIPLPLSTKLPVYIKMDPKDKEREYWRRQRRVFIHSRFLTNEEGVVVAKTVYSNLSIGPSTRMVTSFQGNIANFRTKLRRIFTTQAKKFNMSKEYLVNTNEAKLIEDVTAKMNQNTLKSIWDHWIADPFVDTKLFYDNSNKESVDLLGDITVKLMVIHFKEYFNIFSPRQARTEMRKLDLISRTIVLPDTSELR